MSSSADHLAANLRRLRLARGLTQEQLADKASLDRMQIYNYEAGERRPKIGDSLDAVAAALGVEPHELLVNPKKPPRPTTLDEALAIVARASGYGLVKL